MSKKNDLYNSLKGKIIFGKYKAVKIIGIGSFGGVFQGINIKTKEIIALKFEKRDANSNLLREECVFLSLLKGPGIPKLIAYGRYYNYNVLIQEILGFNLLQIKILTHRYTIKDIGMMGIQIMDRIEFIHSKNIIHRDIKPENFTTGYEDVSTIYLIDFGIARKYRSSRTLKHVKFSLTGRMFGTVRYASYNASRGVEQSRRDDLESIGHMLIYLFSGKLPWKGVNIKDQQRKKKYLDMLLLKKYSPIEKICEDMPEAFMDYYGYCKNLKFEQDPDYEYLRNCFRKMLNDNFDINDFKFSYLFNKNYLNKLKEFNKKINLGNILIHINKKKGKNKSPNPRNSIYNKIKFSLQKSEDERYKNSVGASENFYHERNISCNIIDLNSEKSFKRGKSENAIQMMDKNDISENNNYLNKPKMDLTYKSNFSNYNMEVAEFQDENKNYEQNKTFINKIKNSKNENLNINFNFYENQSYNIISENSNTNIKKIFENFITKNDIENKINISMILEIKRINDIKNNEIKRANSAKIKNNFSRNQILSDKEKKIKKEQNEIYSYIMEKINKYIYKIKVHPINKTKQINILDKPKNNFINVINTDANINNDNSSQINFSFKNKNIPTQYINNIATKVINGQTRNNKSKNVIKNKGIIKRYPKININCKKTSSNQNNFLVKNMPNKTNISNKANGVNIYINTTVHTSYQPKYNKNNNLMPNNSFIPQSQKLVMKNVTNNAKAQNIKKMKINISPYKKIILIPKRHFPKISDNLYYTDNKYYPMAKNNLINSTNISNLNHTMKMNRNNFPSSNSTIKTFDYRPISTRPSYSPKQNMNNINLNIRKILIFDNNIKGKGINSNNYNNRKMVKNHSYDSIMNKIKNQNNLHPNNSQSKLDLMSQNIQNNNNNYYYKYYNLNQQKNNLNVNNMNKIRMRHYSPDNNKEKNNLYKNLLKKDGLFTNIIRHNRSNSNSNSENKKGLNYNYLNLSDKDNIHNILYQPRNINIWNNQNSNNYESRCINKIKAKKISMYY